ncbi:MAG: hypothetical protein NUW22_11565 [Acidobacteria bacterium]|nr:hypothetical protein [Acidobacteriota bacterium]
MEKLGLRSADLFSGPATARPRARVVDTYPYHDARGELIAEKQRRKPKSFRWRRPNPEAKGAWVYDLKGVTLGLYRLPELAGARRVFVVEGEKAADRLWNIDLAGTCGYAGASKWSPEWSQALWAAGCRELIVLPDNDRPGAAHAQVVAAITHAANADEPIAVKVVTLAGLPSGGDVFDWLEGGKSADDLITLVDTVPRWTPGAEEQRRLERRRANTRKRVRKHRSASEPDRPAGDTQQADAGNAAVADVCNALVNAPAPLSGRSIKRLLAGRVPRASVEQALLIGARTGVLVVEHGRHRARLYALGSDIRSVTESGQSASVPGDITVLESTSVHSREEVPLSQCPVTGNAVTPCERSSDPLEKNAPKNIHSVTESRDTGIAGEVCDGQLAAINLGHCCGTNGTLLRCKVCPWSPTYWQRAADVSPISRSIISSNA